MCPRGIHEDNVWTNSHCLCLSLECRQISAVQPPLHAFPKQRKNTLHKAEWATVWAHNCLREQKQWEAPSFPSKLLAAIPSPTLTSQVLHAKPGCCLDCGEGCSPWVLALPLPTQWRRTRGLMSTIAPCCQGLSTASSLSSLTVLSQVPSPGFHSWAQLLGWDKRDGHTDLAASKQRLFSHWHLLKPPIFNSATNRMANHCIW